MPGGFAHIVLVNKLSDREHLGAIDGFPRIAGAAVNRHLKFCEMGAVSPDYPYLRLSLSGDARDAARKWADAMHYERTGDVIKAGVQALREMGGGLDKEKAFAWLLGYAAHVGMDVTVHPVIELKVGTYKGHEVEHRECEMHQDAYIWQKEIDIGELGISEYIDRSLKECGSADNPEILEPAVVALWTTMLQRTYPEAFTENPPDIPAWHRGYTEMVDTAEEGPRLFPIARHMLAGAAIAYPALKDVNQGFINGLATPEGEMNYDQVFARALTNVGRLWGSIAQGVFENDNEFEALIENWDLDTGKNVAGQFGFWRNVA